MNIMDLSNLAISQESQDLILLHPATGEELKDDSGKFFTISLLSADTNAFKSANEKLLKAERDSKSKKTARDREESLCKVLADVTTGCHLIFNGKPLKFSKEAMAELYFNPEFTWIADQVLSFVRDRENFIKS